MKKSVYFIVLVVAMLCSALPSKAQIDFNKTPTDDLGDYTNEFQTNFYEALKQKGIENYDRAIEYLQKCIALKPNEATLYFELGKNYSQLKNYPLAESSLKKALELKPGNVWVLDELYYTYIKQKEYDKAVNTIKELVKYQPKYKEDLANIYAQTKDFENALKVLDELDNEFGVTSEREKLRNRIYKATGKQDALLANLLERKKANPNDESIYLKLIYRYSESEDLDNAFKTAQELLKINPESQLVHLALYKFYLQKEDYKNAVNSMKIVVNSKTIDPTSKSKVLSDFVSFAALHPEYESDLLEVTSKVSTGKSNLDLGNYYYQKNDKEKALVYYKNAYKTNPQNFNLIKQIILLQIDFQQFEDALKFSDDAIEIYPAQPIFYLLNGVTLNALNRPKEAVDVLDIGIDYLIEDATMEKDFYLQLSQAYKALNNLEQSKTFQLKANKIKTK